MNMRDGKTQNRACRGLLAAAITVWCVAPFMAFAAEHPEHPTAKTTAEHPEHPTAAAEESAGLLDGSVFEGEIGKSGDATGDKDEFVFKQGKFVSTTCVHFGFSEEAYVATEKDGVVSFSSEAKNDKGETMSWKGVVKAGDIAGKAIHQTATGETEYWFKGSLKAAESESKPEHPEHPEHPE